MKENSDTPATKSRNGLKILGIVLMVIAVIVTLSAFGTITRLAATETDVARQLGAIVGILIIPLSLWAGAWYCFKKAQH